MPGKTAKAQRAEMRWWKLVLAHRGLAWALSRLYLNKGFDRDDLFQEATLGLYRAALTHDPARGTFGAYGRLGIKTQLRILTEHYKVRDRNRVAFGEAEDHHRRDPTPDEVDEDREDRETIRAAVGRLPIRLRRVVVRHYGLDGAPAEQLKEIAAREGLTPTRLCQLNKEALALLAPALSGLRHADRRRRSSLTAREMASRMGPISGTNDSP